MNELEFGILQIPRVCHVNLNVNISQSTQPHCYFSFYHSNNKRSHLVFA